MNADQKRGYSLVANTIKSGASLNELLGGLAKGRGDVAGAAALSGALGCLVDSFDALRAAGHVAKSTESDIQQFLRISRDGMALAIAADLNGGDHLLAGRRLFALSHFVTELRRQLRFESAEKAPPTTAWS